MASFDPELARLIDQDTPKLNPDLANGLATKHLKHVEKYIDDVFRIASKDFPEGVRYVRCERCTPREEYAEAVRKRNTRRGLKKQTRSTFETARSDLYLMKFFFEFQGKPLQTRYVYLPFVSDAGSIVISGSRFNISPVISDRVISIGETNIFARLLRDKLTFERLTYEYMTPERREIVPVVHGQIYHSNNRKNRPAVPACTTAVHYLFCKYGLKETFQKFADCEPIVVENINYNEWPEEDWVVCNSSGIKPTKNFNRALYTPTNLAIVIPRTKYTDTVRSLVAGFYYVADHFPQQISARYVDDPRHWMLMMGLMLFSGDTNHGRIYDDMKNHIESLDEYIDPIMIERMREIGIVVNDFYEFLAFIINNFNDWLLNYRTKINTMYDKELNVLYHVTYSIIKSFFLIHYKLKSAAKKGLTDKECDNIIGKYLKTGLIYSLIKDSGVVSSSSYSGDNKTFKITSTLVPQSNSSGRGRGKNNDRAAIQDPSKALHVSIAEVAAYSGMPKSGPTGRERINFHCMTDEKGVIVRNPKTKDMLDAIQKNLDS